MPEENKDQLSQTDQNDRPPEGEPLVVGGPEATNPPPELVEIKLDGVKVQVTPEAAEAIKKREGSFQSKLDEQSTELGELRKRASQPVTQADPIVARDDPDSEDFTDLLYTDPTAYAEKLEKRIVTKVSNAYGQQEALKTFWSDFYKANPELKSADLIVQGIMRRDWDEIKDLPRSKSAKILAERSAEAVMAISGTKPVADTKTVTESADRVKDTTAKKDSSEGVEEKGRTLSQIIKANRSRRSNAKFGRTATA